MMMNPEILQHPNIPKPLHGLAPRVVLGQYWWDRTRQKAYESTNYHCIACGVHKTDAKYHQWLEAHENFTMDYNKGIMEINSIIPLCHSCHNFIHSGRLYATLTDDTEEKAKDILRHGFTILEANDLAAFPGTIEVADLMEVEHNCTGLRYKIDRQPEWDEWKMILNGKEYYSKFKDYKDWEQHYANLNKKR